MELERIDELLARYASGDLSDTEVEELLNAVKDDAGLLDKLGEVHRVHMLLQELDASPLDQERLMRALPERSDSSGASRVMHSIASSEPAESRRRRSSSMRVAARRRGGSPILPAAIAAAILLVVTLLVLSGTRKPEIPTRKAENEALQSAETARRGTAQDEPRPSAASRDISAERSQPESMSAETPNSPVSGVPPLPMLPPLPPQGRTITQVPKPAIKRSSESTEAEEIHSERPIGKFAVFTGKVRYARGKEGRWAVATQGVPVHTLDRVDTRLGLARIDFDQGTQLFANKGTTFEIRSVTEQWIQIYVKLGEVYVADAGGRKIQIDTADGTATPVGTRFDAKRTPSSTVVRVEEGAVRVQPHRKKLPAGKASKETKRPEAVRVESGFRTSVQRGAAPKVRRASNRRISWIDPLKEKEPEKIEMAVLSFTLINADTDQPIAAHDPIVNGSEIDVAKLPTENVNIRANVSDVPIGSVQFRMFPRTPAAQAAQNIPPFAVFGDDNPNPGNYRAWKPKPASYELTATPFEERGARGNSGRRLTVKFTIRSRKK